MFSYANRYDDKFEDLTRIVFKHLIDSEEVKNAARQIAERAESFRRGEMSEKEWSDFKKPIKQGLPLMTVCGRSTNGRASAQDMEDAGTFLFDIDGMKVDPRAFFEQRIRPNIAVWDVLLAKVSISGCGIQLVCKRPEGMYRQQAMAWLARQIGVTDRDENNGLGHYDTGTHSLAQKSFMVPREYILYVSDELFEPVPSLQAENSESSEPLKLQPSTNTLNPLPEEGQGARLPQTLADVPEALTFDGVPYRDIQAEYWKENGGEPIEGIRHPSLWTMGSELRSICDYNVGLMLKIMPTYGLPEHEMRTLVCDLCQDKRKSEGVSKVMVKIVRRLKAQTVDTDKVESTAYTDYEISSTLPEGLVRRLPKPLQVTLSMLPKQHGWPALAAWLPMAGCLADRAKFRYCDNTMSHLGLFTFVVGNPSSGKSFMNLIEKSWMHLIKEADREAMAAKQKYKEDMQLWAVKQGQKGAKEEPPQKPQCCKRYIKPRSSAAQLLLQLQEAQGHSLFMFTTEANEVYQNSKAGKWADKYEPIKCAFDREDWGQDYVSDLSVSGDEPVALNCSWGGQYGALHKIFNYDNVDGGLSARFIVAEMPDNSFSEMPKYVEPSDKQKALIDEAARNLMSYEGEVKVPKLTRAINEWEDEKRLEAAKSDDHALDDYRKRAGKIGMRAGVVCYLLSGAKSEPQVAVELALYVANQTLAAQVKFFGETCRKMYEKNAQPSYKKPNAELYDNMPEFFTTADVVQNQHSSTDTAHRTINNWVHADLAFKLKDGHTWGKKEPGAPAPDM